MFFAHKKKPTWAVFVFVFQSHKSRPLDFFVKEGRFAQTISKIIYHLRIYFKHLLNCTIIREYLHVDASCQGSMG